MRPVAYLLLAILLFIDVQGMAIVAKNRCLCLDGGVKFIPPKDIRKIEVYSPSTSCQQLEIIVTLKDEEEQKCLDPDSRFAKNFIKNSQRRPRS